MQVQIVGITKEKKVGKSKKSGKAFSGYFVVFGYERNDMHGLETKTMLYTDEMIARNNGYVPAPGEICEASLTFGGFVENLTPAE